LQPALDQERGLVVQQPVHHRSRSKISLPAKKMLRSYSFAISWAKLLALAHRLGTDREPVVRRDSNAAGELDVPAQRVSVCSRTRSTSSTPWNVALSITPTDMNTTFTK